MSKKKSDSAIRTIAQINEINVRSSVSGKCEAQLSAALVENLIEELGFSFTDGTLHREHRLVRNKKADLLVTSASGKPFLLIEVKDMGSAASNSDPNSLAIKHYAQLAGYIGHNQIPFGILTNGTHYLVYSKAASKLQDPNSTIFRFDRRDLNDTNTIQKVIEYIGRESVLDLNCKSLHRVESDYKDLIELSNLRLILREQTDKLIRFFKSYVNEQLDRRGHFKRKLLDWAKEHGYEVNKKLVDQLAKEGALVLVTRILFYRILEDRGLLPENSPKLRSNKGVFTYQHFAKIFENAVPYLKSIYKTPIFDSILFQDIFWPNDLISYVFNQIADFNFKNIDNDVLGKAYEEHLREENSRNQLGQVYTPEVVREYMFSRTMDLWGKRELPRFADFTCGSGGFLITAYKHMSLKTKNHKDLVQNKLFGCDINPFASQLAIFNLLLCSDEKEKMKHVPNVQVADTLIIPKSKSPLNIGAYHSFYQNSMNKALSEIKDGFDIICSNPPYVNFGFGDRKDLPTEWKEYYRKEYESAEGTLPVQHLFTERYISSLKVGGVGSLILPDKILMGTQSGKIRKYILENCFIREIVLFTNNDRCWGKDAEVGQPVIIFFEKKKKETVAAKHKVSVKLCEGFLDLHSKSFLSSYTLEQSWFDKPELNYRFHLVFDDMGMKTIKNEREIEWPTLGDSFVVHQGIYWKNKEDGNILDRKPRKGNFSQGHVSAACIGSMKVAGKPVWLNVDPRNIQKNKPARYNDGLPKRSFTIPKVIMPRDGLMKAAFDKDGFYFNNNLLIAALSRNFRKKIQEYFNDHKSRLNFEIKILKFLSLYLNSSEFSRRYQLNTLYFDRLHPQVNCDVIERQVFPELFNQEKLLNEAQTLHDQIVSGRIKFKQAKQKINQIVLRALKSTEKNMSDASINKINVVKKTAKKAS